MSGQSIYEIIKGSITEDGRLPHDFSLEKPTAPNQISFAPGMIDGGGVFGHYNPGNPEKEAARIVKLLKQYLRNNKRTYLDEIEEIITKTGALSVVDPIHNGIRESRDDMDLQKLIEFGFDLAKTSNDVNLVKLGISLLGLFELGTNESVLDVVKTLALYDEMTLYSAVAASRWSNGNDVVFWIAKRVGGWGKIQAVERLKPETGEIREWILRDGCSNSVMDAYLGLTCAEKGDLINALRKDVIDDELFDSVSVIIDALLDEGPVDGISKYDHAEEALTLYIGYAKRKAFNIKHLWHVLNIRTFVEDSELSNKDDILARCDEIMNNPDWIVKIKDAIERRDDKDFFYACNSALRMDVDITSLLLSAIKEKPVEYCSYAQRLFSDQSIAAALIDIYESVLPLREMASGMGDYFFSDILRKEHGCLDFILPALAEYPLQGIKLIKTGLNSPVVRERNMACRALSGWVKTQVKPLKEISSELSAEVARIFEIEINEQTKETMKKLLDGGFEEA
jgi:hypothetical protein